MILSWNMYEIESKKATLHGVMLRGRIRKFALETGFTCIVENASDKENAVRFAILNDTDFQKLSDYIKTILPDAVITKVMEAIQNPVLSKLKVNDEERYSI